MDPARSRRQQLLAQSAERAWPSGLQRRATRTAGAGKTPKGQPRRRSNRRSRRKRHERIWSGSSWFTRSSARPICARWSIRRRSRLSTTTMIEALSNKSAEVCSARSRNPISASLSLLGQHSGPITPLISMAMSTFLEFPQLESGSRWQYRSTSVKGHVASPLQRCSGRRCLDKAAQKSRVRDNDMLRNPETEREILDALEAINSAAIREHDGSLQAPLLHRVALRPPRKPSDALVVVFYAGVGFTLDGKDYLAAIDTRIDPSPEIPHTSIDLRQMLEKLRLAKCGYHCCARY